MSQRHDGDPERAGRSVLRVVAIGLLCAAVFVLAHPPMWRGDENGVGQFPGWDLTRVFWADLAFARASIAEGTLPLWNPWDRGGYPFFAEPQSGMFDPVTWLMLAVGLVMGAAPAWLAVLKAVVHYGIAGSGLAAFFRERRLPTWAISFGVLALLWSPRLDKLKDQSALWPTAWLGWLLLASDRALRSPTRWRGVWLGAAIGVVINAGYPPTAFRLALLVVPWAMVIVAQRLGLLATLLRAIPQTRRLAERMPVSDHQLPKEERGAYARALVGALAIAAMVATALSAGQIWATLSVLPDTVRSTMDAGHLVASRTEPAHAWGLFAPGDTIAALLVYGGSALPAAAAVAVLAKDRAEALAFVVVGVLGFGLACGDNLPLLPAVADWPGFRSFRIAGHYLTLSTSGLVIAATFGVARLGQLKGEARWYAALAAGFSVSAWATHASNYSAASIAVVLASAALVAGLGFVAAHRQARLGWALVLVLAFDLWHAGRPVAEILQPLPTNDRADAMIAAMGDEDVRSVYRVADFEWAGRRIGPRRRVRDIAGHRPALTSPRYLELYELAQRSSNILRAMNVAVVGFSKKASGSELTRDLRAVRKQRQLFSVESPWPLAYWTDRVAVVDKHPEARVWLRMQREPAAVLERPWLPEGFDEDYWGTHLRDGSRPEPRSRGAELVAQRPDHIELRIDAPRPGMLVVVEGYDAGWRAWVDGEPAALLRANVIFRAIPIEAGVHDVVLSYRPPGVVALWLLWVLTSIGLLAAGIRWLWIRRGRSAESPPDATPDDRTTPDDASAEV